MKNRSGSYFKALKIVIALVVLFFIVVVGWLSISLVWYPAYDELDQQKLTLEADILLARCRDNPIRSDKEGDYILHVESQTPYIYSLVRDKERHRCGEGVLLTLWDDFLLSSAGVYIASEKGELPETLKPYAANLAGRIYKWHRGK